MSMLSAQCEELRILADELRQLREHSADWLPEEAVTLVSSEDAMREAADTILSLRERLWETREDYASADEHKARIESLEELCIDMYRDLNRFLCVTFTPGGGDEYAQRIDALGLLGVDA